ncbi:unnamed protein product [Arctogadus glacialis]
MKNGSEPEGSDAVVPCPARLTPHVQRIGDPALLDDKCHSSKDNPTAFHGGNSVPPKSIGPPPSPPRCRPTDRSVNLRSRLQHIKPLNARPHVFLSTPFRRIISAICPGSRLLYVTPLMAYSEEASRWSDQGWNNTTS